MSTPLMRSLEWIEARVADLAALPLLVMMGVVTVDVLMRYAANSPLAWSYDLVSMYLMPAIIFPSMAIVQRRRHHVNVDLLYRRFPASMQRIAGAISLAGSGCVLALVAWLSGRRAWIAFVDNEVVSGPIEWPIWIGPALLSFGAILFVLRVIADLAAIAGGRAIDPGSGESERLGPVEPS